jgi:hypothetical protein
VLYRQVENKVPIQNDGRVRWLYLRTTSHGFDWSSCMQPASGGKGSLPIRVDIMFTGKLRKQSC